jgi:alkylresorcinol/alkylpyrone synthase
VTPLDRHASGGPDPSVRAGLEGPPVTIHGVATAYPPYRLTQNDIAAKASEVFRHRPTLMERMATTFANSGVHARHSCVPLAWYGLPHGWSERMRLFEDNAVQLLAEAGREVLRAAGVSPADVAATVTVSSTGIATPSLDSLLQSPLGLSPTVQRLPIFGLGCAGGVIGLSRAAVMAQALPGRWVLFFCVELCGLTFRRDDDSKANIIATTIFGDGAAAVLLRALLKGEQSAGVLATVEGWGEHTWPDTRDVMGWRIEGDGLGVVFSHRIPALIEAEMKSASDAFLRGQGCPPDGIDGYVVHPGGEKVVRALEAVYGLGPSGLPDARAVLAERGNMSAVTVLAVLERVLKRGAKGRHLMSALGPGFSAAFALLTLR